MARVQVANVNEVPEGGFKKVEFNGEAVALFKVGGRIYATANICTHTGCELDHNHQMHGEVVECTCHGSRFDVKTGAVVLPPAEDPLKTYQVSVEGEEIFIEA